MRLYFCIATITSQKMLETNISIQHGLFAAKDKTEANGAMLAGLRERFPNGLISYGPEAHDVTEDARAFVSLYPEPTTVATKAA